MDYFFREINLFFQNIFHIFNLLKTNEPFVFFELDYQFLNFII